jgi:hypothetical protein
MVDNSRLVDMSGEDIVVNTVRYSSGQGSQGFAVIDNTGNSPTVVSGTTATITEAIMETGLIVTTNAGATTLTTDTAANIIKAMNLTSSGAQIGDVITFTVGCVGAGGVTVALGSGVTNPNTVSLTVATNAQRKFFLTVTGTSTPAMIINA